MVSRLTWMVAWLFLLVGAMPAHAGLPETPRFRQLTVADGLPSNSINGLAEDRHGYLWIATSDGLARFDGVGYRVWRVEQGLRDNFVWTVKAGPDNRLWFGTNTGGLGVMDSDRTHIRFYNSANTLELLSDMVWSVAVTSKGVVWFGTARGLYRLDTSGKLTRFMPREDDPRSLPGAEVPFLGLGTDDTLWVGTRVGAARWTGRDFERVPLSEHEPAVDGVLVEPSGAVWFASPSGVTLRRPDGSYSRKPWGESTVFSTLLSDRTGQYWLDIREGLGRDSDGHAVNVPLYSDIAQGVVRPSWRAALEDSNGGLWFGSGINGLWYLPGNWRQFTVLSRRLVDPASMGNAEINSIAPASNGDLWLVGSGGYLDRFDPENGDIEHVHTSIGFGALPRSVVEDGLGHVWVSYGNGLTWFDPETKRARRWRADDKTDPVPRSSPASILAVLDNLLWLGTSSGGLQRRDLDGHVLDWLKPGDGRGLRSGGMIQALKAGLAGVPWVIESGRLLKWDEEQHALVPVPGVMQTSLTDFTIDAEQRVWLGGDGILERYRQHGGTMKLEFRMTSREGLPLVAFEGLTVDAAGIVWVTTTRGLIRVDPRQRSARLYTVQDGLPSQHFSSRPVARPGDGRILAGTPEGLVMFDPAVVTPSKTVPKLVIEAIDVMRGGRRMRIPATGNFVLNYEDRDLRVITRLLSFNDARANIYRFRLQGYDTDWVEGASLGERVFPRLQPGDYELELTARNTDNVWSEKQVIRFKVTPPWWRTPPAMVAFAAIVVLLIWWVLASYRRRLKRRLAWQRSEHEREVAKQASLAKTRFLATLGHEVRTPMTGVLGMSELLLETRLDQRQRSYIESIRGAGEHLMRLMNDALDLARIESGRLELADQAFDLRAEVEETSRLMASLAQKRGLAFEVDVAPDTPRGLRGDASRVRQILLNLLSNAIKFTEQGKVSLQVEALLPQGVRFVVTDTGPGLNEEQKTRLFRRFEQAEGVRTAARYGGSGLGLAICQELAAAMDGHIRVDSEPGAGARFVFDLPLPTADAPELTTPVKPIEEPLGAGAPLALLLVEDDPTVAEVIASLLRAQGHRVTHVANGLAALSEAATASFDLALLDLDLPGINGLDLARQLRTQGFRQPLVAVTARADADAEPQAFAAGFNRFLRKPVTGVMLADTINRISAAAD